jgi:hypothetical protein
LLAARINRHTLLACCTATRRFHHHPLACCISMRRIPVGRLSVLLWTLILYVALIILKHAGCCSYHSGSNWYTRMFYPFLSLRSVRRLWWSVPLTAAGLTSEASLPFCLLLGVAASRYNTNSLQIHQL